MLGRADLLLLCQKNKGFLLCFLDNCSVTAIEIPKGQRGSPAKVHSWFLASPARALTTPEPGREERAAPNGRAVTAPPPPECLASSYFGIT